MFRLRWLVPFTAHSHAQNFETLAMDSTSTTLQTIIIGAGLVYGVFECQILADKDYARDSNIYMTSITRRLGGTQLFTDPQGAFPDHFLVHYEHQHPDHSPGP